MKKLLFSLILLLGSASAVNAGEFGEAHNRYLDCLRKTLPRGPVAARDIMSALLNNCRYTPPSANASNFVETYGRLLESTMRSLQAGGLTAVLNSYSDRFTAMHMGYLNQIESIVKAQNPREAITTLNRLHAEATRQFRSNPNSPNRGTVNSDVAVLAAIDIAASSIQYWERNAPANEMRMMVKWWQVVLADVAGGIVGGVFGAGVGAVGLGGACSAAVGLL